MVPKKLKLGVLCSCTTLPPFSSYKSYVSIILNQIDEKSIMFHYFQVTHQATPASKDIFLYDKPVLQFIVAFKPHTHELVS
jgi:hypothetical protein